MTEIWIPCERAFFLCSSPFPSSEYHQSFSSKILKVFGLLLHVYRYISEKKKVHSICWVGKLIRRPNWLCMSSSVECVLLLFHSPSTENLRSEFLSSFARNWQLIEHYKTPIKHYNSPHSKKEKNPNPTNHKTLKNHNAKIFTWKIFSHFIRVMPRGLNSAWGSLYHSENIQVCVPKAV